MAFSSVLGASSVVKPGVVTTATRPSSPFVGQLIYDTTLSTVLVWNGTAWTGTGGLVYLTGGTFTAVSAVSLAANTFTATYRNYLLNINITAGVSTDAQPLHWRGRASGTDNTTANHSFALGGRRYSDGLVTVGGNNVNQSSGRLSLLTSGNSNSVTATFFAPQLASRTSVVTNSTGRGVGDPDAVLQGGGFLDATTQFDSLSFYLASGTITGTYEVYGYAIA